MNIRSQLALLNNVDVNHESFRNIIRAKIFNVINFVNARFKIIFDDKHKSMIFNTENKVYLRLHHEYFLSEKENFKLFNQRVDSFVIKRKVDNATYELELSSISRIHSVISIAQLKSASELDSFNRSRSTNLESIHIKEDTLIKKSYEMKRILKKRTRKYEKFAVIQYLVK